MSSCASVCFCFLFCIRHYRTAVCYFFRFGTCFILLGIGWFAGDSFYSIRLLGTFDCVIWISWTVILLDLIIFTLSNRLNALILRLVVLFRSLVVLSLKLAVLSLRLGVLFPGLVVLFRSLVVLFLGLIVLFSCLVVLVPGLGVLIHRLVVLVSGLGVLFHSLISTYRHFISIRCDSAK